MNGFVIPFAFQNWSEHYEWWVPNNCPADFIIDGEKRLPYSHDWMYFDFGTDHSMRGSSIDYFNLPAAKSDILANYKNVKYVHLDELPQGTKYIYPIIIRTWDYFLKMEGHGFKFLSGRVSEDVRNGLAKIVFMHPWEGPCGEPDWAIIHNWAKRADFKKDQVYFIHGNFKTPSNDLNFTYFPVSAFQMNWKTYANIVDFNPTNERNLFLCYNRATRKHRTLTVCELIHNDLFDRGIISYHNPSRNVTDLVLDYKRTDLLDSAKVLNNKLPLELEYDLATTNPVDELTERHHSETFLSLVTETLVEDEVEFRNEYRDPYKYSPIFFSEKTWKPISIGQPFIIIASSGHLEYLKSLGYKTFDKWWSEEYDTVTDTNLKIKLIMQELVKLSKMSILELMELRNDMAETLTHNQKIFNAFKDEYKNQKAEPVYRIIKDIWASQ